MREDTTRPSLDNKDIQRSYSGNPGVAVRVDTTRPSLDNKDKQRSSASNPPVFTTTSNLERNNKKNK